MATARQESCSEVSFVQLGYVRCITYIIAPEDVQSEWWDVLDGQGKLKQTFLIGRQEVDELNVHFFQVRLADLHVFVVPLELWLEKYRTAFNNIALESVSAGFVR